MSTDHKSVGESYEYTKIQANGNRNIQNLGIEKIAKISYEFDSNVIKA